MGGGVSDVLVLSIRTCFPTCHFFPAAPETESSSGGLEIWQIVVIAIAIVIAVLAVVFFTVIGIVFCLNAKAGVVFQQGTKGRS